MREAITRSLSPRHRVPPSPRHLPPVPCLHLKLSDRGSAVKVSLPG
ncbi:MAG: hypothetical protein SWY16_15875 [Cyanobacteriota bacterium]|nr:hypothetical protein [Cyanobacteriota bacterium]